MVIPFIEPYSYTGEESAEIHCHGNPLILKNILKILFEIGFQKAEPGEFTKRAYLNNKLDLTQAEAVKEIIESRGEKELQNALYLKEGIFKKHILAFKSKLLNLLADLSAELDFIDEDIQFTSKKNKINILNSLIKDIKELLKNANEMERYRDGIEISILGFTNVGKSSLLNYFAGSDRAIVSELPGTTRDYLEILMNIKGMPVKMIDTAGIRDNAENTIEKEGIRRSINKAKESDILFILLDASLEKSKSLKNSPLDQLCKLAEKTNLIIFFILNKWDIVHNSWKVENFKNVVINKIKFKNKVFYEKTSVKSEYGLKSLQNNLHKVILSISPHTDGIMMSAWQKEIFEEVLVELEESLNLILLNEALEVIVSCIQNSVDLLGKLTGEVQSEDLLGRIFSRFCIGK